MGQGKTDSVAFHYACIIVAGVIVAGVGSNKDSQLMTSDNAPEQGYGSAKSKARDSFHFFGIIVDL